MDNRLLGVKSSPGKGFCISFGLLPSVSSPQDAIGQKPSSLSAGKMTMNKINEASSQWWSSWWCLQWGVYQHLSPATRSPFYCPKMLLLFCCRSLSPGVQGCLIIQHSQCYTPDCSTLSFKWASHNGRKSTQADFPPRSFRQLSLITAGSDWDGWTWRLTGSRDSAPI